MEATSTGGAVYVLETIDLLYGRILNFKDNNDELHELLSEVDIELVNISFYKNLNTIDLKLESLIHSGYRYQMFFKETQGKTEVLFSGEVVSSEGTPLVRAYISKEEVLRSYKEILNILAN